MTWRYENLGHAFQNGGEEPIFKKISSLLETKSLFNTIKYDNNIIKVL